MEKRLQQIVKPQAEYALLNTAPSTGLVSARPWQPQLRPRRLIVMDCDVRVMQVQIFERGDTIALLL